jgi:hypothetical protein
MSASLAVEASKSRGSADKEDVSGPCIIRSSTDQISVFRRYFGFLLFLGELSPVQVADGLTLGHRGWILSRRFISFTNYISRRQNHFSKEYPFVFVL